MPPSRPSPGFRHFARKGDVPCGTLSLEKHPSFGAASVSWLGDRPGTAPSRDDPVALAVFVPPYSCGAAEAFHLFPDRSARRPDGSRASLRARRFEVNARPAYTTRMLRVRALALLLLAVAACSTGREARREDTGTAPARFRDLVGARTGLLKGLLLDQSFAAGVGNWIADEVLYQAGLDPRRHEGRVLERAGRAWCLG